jgi:hypothetical protein
MNQQEVENIAVKILINHEPTHGSSDPFGEIEKATGLPSMDVRLLVDGLIRRGLVHFEAIVTNEFSSDAQRWCWKTGPLN